MDSGLGGLRFRQLSVLVGMALGLSACGGGGNGNVKPAAPYTPPTPGYQPPTPGQGGGSTPPTTPPPAPPTNPPPTPPVDAQLSLTNAKAAQQAGFTGTGVTIGVVDTGIMRNHPALAGKVTKELAYIDPATNNLAVDDVIGHGTWVSEIAAGSAFGKFAGGVAPGASLVSARILSDNAGDDNGSAPPAKVTASTGQFLGYVNADLIKAGAKVMNNSWGGITWDTSDTATTKAFHDAYSNYINTWGGLVVFAAGNDSQANPSTTAALPSVPGAQDLEKGWLAVVAVNSNNPTQLSSYSNQCGVAMNYCLAAPGEVIVSGKDDTANNATYWIVGGTSLAAPQVSGAAALVWQAFPYFTNDQVRQTLLGTADDLGAPGVDPVFGYGMLDVGKAVKGPGRFDWGTFSVTLNTNSTWGNAISGNGGLTKDGTGTLTLTQAPSYQGDTHVVHGALAAPSLAGALYLDNVDAVMTGAHSFGADVQNLGTLVVAGGDVHVNGSYYQGFSQTDGQIGRLAVELGRSLNVDGKAVLVGGNLYVIGAMQGYVANAHTNVLTAKGGLSGTFTGLDVAQGVLLSASLNYDSTSAWLNVTQVQASAVTGMSYTPASFGAAQRVDNAFGAINEQLAQGGATTGGGPVPTGFIEGAANLQQTQTTAALQRSLESLSGQLHAASTAMTFEAIDAGTRALSDHFDGLANTRTTGGWAQTLGYHGSMSRSGYGDVGYDLSGWMAGQDRKLGANGVLGFAVSQSQGLGRLAEYADQGTSNAVEGMLYGGVMHDDWYTMGRLGYGTYRENMRRHIELGSDLAGVASDTNGRYTVAYGESGYHATLGGLDFTPYANMQYAHIQRDGFNELGGYGFGLKAGTQNVERWQAGVGVRVGHSWSFAHGRSLSLQGRAQWQQAFAMHGDVFDASFTGVDQWAPVGGVGLSRYEGQVGLSLDWTMSARSSVQFGMDQYVGQNSQGMMGTLNYRLSF
ncbi:autotransporter-associated beta strand repeat-containing protein [Dyella jiangningensis]|uniref:S8 family serine peptidase n=1 Tax=Dyella sp. AtDHG13 TaxID=1938897 RepID=UPI00088F1EFD|nr:S8 family serine peptidase [Dyella sp. AtDHG13]SDK71679.1 autotransporter-associated beta strand repeat-containing protein [Dyella jiangningensis]